MKKMTRLQVNSLLLWTRLEGRPRSMNNIAVKLGVSRTAVLKNLNFMVAEGILDEEYNMTGPGRDYVEQMEQMYRLLLRWMRLHGVVKEEWKDAFVLMAEMGPSFLKCMTNQGFFCSICRSVSDRNPLWFGQADLSRFLPGGTYKACVEFWKTGKENERSMADRAFVKPSCLSVEDSHSDIILRRLKITHFSPQKHGEASGKMRSMEYSMDGKRRKAEVAEDVVRIPTEAIEWCYNEQECALTGRLKVTFTCTAGFHDRERSKAEMRIRIVGTDMSRE